MRSLNHIVQFDFKIPFEVVLHSAVDISISVYEVTIAETRRTVFIKALPRSHQTMTKSNTASSAFNCRFPRSWKWLRDYFKIAKRILSLRYKIYGIAVIYNLILKIHVGPKEMHSETPIISTKNVLLSDADIASQTVSQYDALYFILSFLFTNRS